MEVDEVDEVDEVEEEEEEEEETSREAAGGAGGGAGGAGGGSNYQDKLETLTQEEQAGEDSASGSSCTPCLLTKALKLPTIKEMLESLDQWRRVHGTTEDTGSSLDHGLISLNIRNREDEARDGGLGFCVAISLTDGTVLHTTPSLTSTLGYPGNTSIFENCDLNHPRGHVGGPELH